MEFLIVHGSFLIIIVIFQTFWRQGPLNMNPFVNKVLFIIYNVYFIILYKYYKNSIDKYFNKSKLYFIV